VRGLRVACGSMRKPGRTTVFSCPFPHSGLASRPQTLRTHLARYAAMVVRLWPPPITTTSKRGSSRPRPSCAEMPWRAPPPLSLSDPWLVTCRWEADVATEEHANPPARYATTCVVASPPPPFLIASPSHLGEQGRRSWVLASLWRVTFGPGVTPAGPAGCRR
jgi:hypothetical protein